MNTIKLMSLLCLLLSTPLLAQPGFDDYYWQPQVAKTEDMLADYHNNPVDFRARYFPKLGIPIQRDDYFGVWNWFNHGAYPTKLVYDKAKDKKTYFFCRRNGSECGHNAVDWLVSYRNFGANEVINPFPHGATVKVTHTYDAHPDVKESNSLGNTVELTCYLDGDPNNEAEVNLLKVRLSHLKQYSLLVRNGDFVRSGHVLGQIGYSGATDFIVTHAHTTYQHMGVWLDPFDGTYNSELRTSMLYNQGWIENITNWNEIENTRHLTLNNKFHVTMRNNTKNTYTFRAAREIQAIRVINQWGQIVSGYDVLDQPDIEDLTQTSYPVRFDDGQERIVHEVSFKWQQNADPALINREIPFLIESEGKLSNRVFVTIVK